MDTLNKTYKDASNTYKETNKDVIESEKANQRFTNVMANVGAIVEPVLNKLKNSFANVVEGIMPMVEQAIPMIVAGLEQLIPFVSQFAETIIPVVMNTVSQLLPVFINLATSVLPLIAQAIMAHNANNSTVNSGNYTTADIHTAGCNSDTAAVIATTYADCTDGVAGYCSVNSGVTSGTDTIV